MKKLAVYLGIFTFLPVANLHAQCDTAFYSYKRAIIERVSNTVDSVYKFENPSKYIRFEFTDYMAHNYSLGSSRGVGGFFCIRIDSCNFYQRELGNKKSNLMYLADINMFEDFMVADIYDTINLHQTHTLAKVIENPVEGWKKIELFYFEHKSRSFQSQIIITVPSYVLKDRKITKVYLFTIGLRGTNKEDIELLNFKEMTF